MRLIYACSSNPGKLREFELVATELGSTNVGVLPLPDLKQIKPPDEDGATFEANAEAKALYYSRYSDEIVLADDSGIEVNALNKAPGVFSARYSTPHLKDRPAQDAANNRLLLENMRDQNDRTARFVCAVALAQRGTVLHLVKGVVEGQLLKSARGSDGFGYDPLFFYPPYACTFAELDGRRRFSVSARGSALRQTILWLDPEAGSLS